LVDVVAAVIRQNGKVLICQRPLEKRHGGLWEFPGGKVEPDESFVEAVRRELGEELGVSVKSVGKTLLSVRDPGSEFVINFVETVVEGRLTAREHIDLAWVSLDSLPEYDLAGSDRIFGAHLIQGQEE
jgi:mutator protein MutT